MERESVVVEATPDLFPGEPKPVTFSRGRTARELWEQRSQRSEAEYNAEKSRHDEIVRRTTAKELEREERTIAEVEAKFAEYENTVSTLRELRKGDADRLAYSAERRAELVAENTRLEAENGFLMLENGVLRESLSNAGEVPAPFGPVAAFAWFIGVAMTSAAFLLFRPW